MKSRANFSNATRCVADVSWGYLKSLVFITVCVGGLHSSYGQNGLKSETSIEDELPIPSSVFIPPPPPKAVPDLKVEASTNRSFSTHRITILRAEPSTLPDIPLPPIEKPFTRRTAGESDYLLSFGATVYDHKLSLVRWYDPRTKQNFEAWCAWDWTLLSPLPELNLGDKLRSFHLFASNIDTNKVRRQFKSWNLPTFPVLEEGTFFIITKTPDNTEATRILATLRDYYIKHKERLVLIQAARQQYQKNAAAWHAANPPKPQNHSFWLKPHRGSRYLSEKGGTDAQ